MIALRSRTGVAVAALVAALVVASPSLRGQSSSQGEWSSVFGMPLVAVHAALMPTGQLLFFDAWEIPGTPSARLWDPDTGVYTPVPAGFAELFCAGHILTHDGRLLTAGGHNGAGVGTPDTTVFDATTQQWTSLPDLAYARWYPSLVQLADGRAFTIGGAISRPNTAEVPEALTLGGGSWTPYPAAFKDVGEYPLMLQGPDGRLFVSEYQTSMSWWLDPNTSGWTSIGPSPAASGPGVMYRPGKVLMAGGGTLNADPVVTRTGVIDLNQPTPAWREVDAMQYGRSQHNLVILPDGKVLVVGGASEVSLISTSGVLPAEIFDPDTEQWTTVAAMATPRMYHSIAILLPDGRVLAAGGGRINPGVPDETNGEFYSPPYLFKEGARPVATSAPATVGYGQSFAVQTPDAGAVARVTFVRISSVTHGINLDQRFFELPFTAGGGAVVAEAPADARLAPAGDYFVFLLNDQGVPSIGRRVRLGGAGGTATLDVSDASVNEGTGTANTLVFSVTRTGDDSQTVTVQYATSNGSAEAGSDYVATSGSLTFPPNTASRTVSVPTVPDDDVEPNETLTLTLSAPINAAIGDGSATGTIVNDDEPPPPTLAIGNATVVEGSGGATPVARFTVTLSAASSSDVLVNYRTLAGTATPGSDFTTTNGVLSFAGGSVVQTIQVPVHPDLDVEPAETFVVELFAPINADLLAPIGTGTIFDDDPGIATTTVVVAAGDDDVNEAGGVLATAAPTLVVGRSGTADPSLLGLRFALPLPAGATILEAWLELTPTDTQSGPLAFEYAVAAGANAAPFSSAAPPSMRALLAPRLTHASNDTWTANVPRRLDDIAPLVQAAIAQPGWAATQAVALVMRATGAGRRDIAAAEAGPAAAPRLVVTFMIGTPTPNAPRALTSQVSAYDVAFNWAAPPPAGRPVTGYVLEAGVAPGHTLVTLPLGDVRQTSVRAPEGVFFVRVRAVTIAGTGPPSNEVRVATGTLAAPLAPTALLATVQGTRVTFQWTHGPAGNVATAFQLQAGTSAGVVDLGVLPVVGAARSVTIDAPPGTYHVRVVALNPSGTSSPSPSVVVTPGPGVCTLPLTPIGLSVSSSAGAIAVTWAAPQSGAIPTGYQVRAASASGVADIAVLNLPPQLVVGGPVPSGRYFIQVAATNACGASVPSAEVSAVVP